MDGLAGLSGTFSTILIDPPWRFDNRTGKMAPEHKRLRRYETLSMEEIAAGETRWTATWTPGRFIRRTQELASTVRDAAAVTKPNPKQWAPAGAAR